MKYEWIRGAAALTLALLVAGCGGGAGTQPTVATALKADAAPAFSGNGTWWVPTEPGTGFFFEAQGATGVATFFVFDAEGRPTWVSAAGSFIAEGAGFRFQGGLQRFRGGQAANVVYHVLPTATAVGNVSIAFSGTSAQVTLPQRSFTAQKFSTLATPVAGLQPETGIYWNPDQSGRGYTVEALGDTLTVTMFHYDERGEPTWHLAAGPMRAGGFNAGFMRYSGGQTLDGPYRAPAQPLLQGALGASFVHACSANLWLPGMDSLAVRRFSFGGLPAGGECRWNSGPAARTAAEGPLVANLQSILASASKGFSQPTAVAVDAAGNAYVTDEGTHTVMKVARDGTTTTIAGLAGESGFADGRGTGARFAKPAGIAVDAQGVLYVSDRENNAIRKILPDGTVTTLAGRPHLPEVVNGPLASARFSRPGRLKIDAAGNLYVAEGGGVRKIGTDGMVSALVGGLSVNQRLLGDGANAGFHIVQSVAVDATGNVYVTELDTALRGWLRKFDAAGRMVALPDTVDGTRPLIDPTDLAVDENGNLYVLSSGSETTPEMIYQGVFKITPQGVTTLYAGAVVPRLPAPGQLTRLMGEPFGIALDPGAAGGRRAMVADHTGRVWQLLP
ncbi:hypothetical protein FN976_11600 [Caenimonas sedimenti]|uniref:SMP-30/Gluconolactonase/LRE-like region domain-containing protein n=1 Tax=Caenimonas sedimenti TaxID=2596921 RepID=A0A562ZS33_9BURK|nr:hypothetical protein [Caenimonas sedimenti]TWO70964.1 hypothetical protein FN976_11600 [Caenimonas sedimenti]